MEAADERALNFPIDGQQLRLSDMRQNHHLCLNSLNALCRAGKMNAKKLADGEVGENFELTDHFSFIAHSPRIKSVS